MRWLAVPVLSGDRVVGVLVATEFLRRQQDALTATIMTVSVVTVLVLVGACLLAWGAAGRALRAAARPGRHRPLGEHRPRPLRAA